MALRNSPYLPLYVQDFLTDEKLADCSAAANGVYIRLMCILHKSETYGKILLKQKYKQKSSTCLNFASMFVRQMPYSEEEISDGLEELLQNKIIEIDGDLLFQKRMVRDGLISDKRAVAGAKGGAKTFAQAKIQANTKAKHQANSENEYENENIEEKSIKNKFNFRKEIIDLGVDAEVADEWLKVRKTKKATNTKIAFAAIEKQILLSGASANDCIRCSVEHSWSGFKAEWFKDSGYNSAPQNVATFVSQEEDWQS